MNRGMVGKYLRAVGAAFEMTLRQNVLDAFILFTILIQPLVIAMLALWMLRLDGDGRGIFVVVGSGLTGLWSSLLFVSGNGITHERWTGTLEALVGVPTPLPVIVFGKTLASVAQSLASMIVAYLLAALIFDFAIYITLPLAFLISLFFTVLSFVAFGLLIAPLFVLNPSIQAWQNALEFPMYILAGFLFPIALLPGWTTPISYILAPYWAARALHGAAEGGASLTEISFCWLMMLVLSLVYLAVSSLLFRGVAHKTRVNGTLGLQ